MPSLRSTPVIRLPVILVGAALLSIPFHVRPDNFIVDDGYFYPQIARYIAHGQGSTFNGLLLTNGYHPLWMLVCVLGASITSASTALVQLLSCVQDLLTLTCVVLVVKIYRAAGFKCTALGCAPILFFSMVVGIWRLLEANLALALQLCVLVVAIPIFPELQMRLGKWRSALLGLLLGLTLLARLDLVFFILIVQSYQLLPGAFIDRSSRLKSVAVQALILCAVAAPYFFWNWHTFHHLLPVSGAIKSTFPHLQRWRIDLIVLPVIASIVVNALLLLKRRHSEFEVLCLITAAASAMHLAYTLSFGDLAHWYLTTGYLSVSFCAMWLTDLAIVRRLFQQIEVTLSAAMFLFFLLLASLRTFSNFSYSRLMHGTVRLQGVYVEPKRSLAEKLRETYPAGSRFFIFDAPGGVAYYSRMSILPSDGLVSNYSYNQELAHDGFAKYASRHHIDYLIAPHLEDQQRYARLFLESQRTALGQEMHFEAPLTRTSAGSIVLYDNDLLFRSPEINPDLEKEYPEVGVWRIPH